MTFLRRTFPSGIRDILQSLDPEEIRHLVSETKNHSITRSPPTQEAKESGLKGSSAASPESFVKTQPSHWLFCPHLWPRPPPPSAQIHRQIISPGPKPDAEPARNSDDRVDPGIPRSRSSGTNPGGKFHSPEKMGTLWMATAFGWAPGSI